MLPMRSAANLMSSYALAQILAFTQQTKTAASYSGDGDRVLMIVGAHNHLNPLFDAPHLKAHAPSRSGIVDAATLSTWEEK
jgi:hypothetical protein